MTEKTRKNIARAFAEESRVLAQMSPFILKAEREGYKELARLFRAVENAKSIHARRFRLLMRGKIGSTRDNLSTALENEIKAKDRFYPQMIKEARDASTAVKKAFAQTSRTDEEYTDLFRSAMEDMLTDSETVYYVCQICGHIHKNGRPERCPVCKAVPGRFKELK